MVGYHYTSARNWGVIQREGLKPYRVESIAKVATAFNVPDTGVWTYARRQRGLSHLGCILWQAITKKTTQVVLLRVKYPKEWALSFGSGKVPLFVQHDLVWNGFHFHDQTDARIVLRTISPGSIRLVNQYDISKLADFYDRGTL